MYLKYLLRLMEKLIWLLKGMVPILCESDHVDFVESDHVAPPLMIRDFVMPSYCRDNNHFPLVTIFSSCLLLGCIRPL